ASICRRSVRGLSRELAERALRVAQSSPAASLWLSWSISARRRTAPMFWSLAFRPDRSNEGAYFFGGRGGIRRSIGRRIDSGDQATHTRTGEFFLRWRHPHGGGRRAEPLSARRDRDDRVRWNSGTPAKDFQAYS